MQSRGREGGRERERERENVCGFWGAPLCTRRDIRIISTMYRIKHRIIYHRRDILAMYRIVRIIYPRIDILALYRIMHRSDPARHDI